MNLFHVAPIPLGVGSVIEPGNFGRLMKTNPTGSFFAHRESIYECIRLKEAPEKPSRLDAIFLLPSEEDARAYQAQFDTRGIIYEVELLNKEARWHASLVDFVIVSHTNTPQIPVGQVEEAARRYWRYESTEGMGVNATGTAEVIVASPVRLIRRIT